MTIEIQIQGTIFIARIRFFDGSYHTKNDNVWVTRQKTVELAARAAFEEMVCI